MAWSRKCLSTATFFWKYLQFDDGSFETSWQHTVFTMLPKSNDKSQPNNWKPIALSENIYIYIFFFPVALQHTTGGDG